MEVADFLPLADRLSLSTTSRSWREILVPKLFTILRVTNRNEDQEILNTVLNKYGDYVHQLYFECFLYPDEDPDSDEDDNSEVSKQGDLPNLICRLIGGDDLPVTCRTLTVDFKPEDNFEGEGWGADQGSIYIHDEAEDEDSIAVSEGNNQWRANLVQAWTLIATNRSTRRLSIVNLPPKATSAWFTAEWHSFLGQLEELSIGIWGGDNGAGWHSNTTDGYLDFLFQLGNYFFHHAQTLKRLYIKADAENPYGCEGFRHAALGLAATDMPVLKYLYLENCFIDPALISFLQAHAKKIRELHLENCLSAFESGMATNPVTWAEFFGAIRTSAPILDELRVHINAAPLTSEEQFHGDEQNGPDGAYILPDDEPDDVKAVRRAVREEGRTVFPYYHLDDKYGMVFANEEVTIERFEGREDQNEYDALLELVQENAKARS